LRKTLLEKRRAVRELEKALDELRKTNAKVHELQGDVSVMRAWTRHIRDEGRWISLEDFVSRHRGMAPAHGIPTEGLRKLLDAPSHRPAQAHKS
jgi:hypothetical protein